jgi:mannose-6-phosphate isomerase-like protein (cupin superfamily)
MKIISTENADRYKWGNICDGWHLLRSDHLSIIQEHMPSGTSEVAHYHNRSHQFFYVLSGQLSIELDGEIHELGARQGLEIRPKSKHRVFNNSTAAAQFLVVSSPPSHGDRITSRRTKRRCH